MIPAAVLAVLLAGAVPNQPAWFVKVDLCVINHVRSFNTEWDQWDRPRFKPSSTTWVSFWSICWTPPLPYLAASVPVALVNHGWRTTNQTRNIVPCEDGWIIENKDGINVIARDVWVVASPYDWEMRNRRLYCPLRKP